jgi:N6-L-threonylcarbamoyladenine synthase
MKVLGIDTILHDACAAIVENGRFVLSNAAEHTIMESNKLYCLADLHLNQIGRVIEKALKKADCRLSDISLISVNNFGSFFSNTLIGVTAAQVLAQILKKPLVTVHHQEAHYFSNWLERKEKDFSFPILVLSSSGGHSSIVKILNGKFKFRELYRIEGMEEKKKSKPNFRGIGAVYGYVADALKIGGPIGSAPVIAEYAKKGNTLRFDFSRKIGDFDLTKLDFSPMEKAVRETINREQKNRSGFPHQFICDLAASFEDSMAHLISDGLMKLAAREKAREIHLVGGISANDTLRKVTQKKCFAAGFEFKYPTKKPYCIDNAAMIASLGYYKYRLLSPSARKLLLGREIMINSNLRLEQMSLNQRLNKNVQ